MGRRMLRTIGAGLMEAGNQGQIYRKEELEKMRQANLLEIAKGKQGLMAAANTEQAKQNERMFGLKQTEDAASAEHRKSVDERAGRMELAGINAQVWSEKVEKDRIKALKVENDRTFATTMHNDFMSQAETFSEKRPDIQLTPLGAGILKTAAGSGWSAPEILEFLQDPGVQVSDEMEKKSPGMRAQVEQYRLLTDGERTDTIESIQALQLGIEQIWKNTKGRDTSAPPFSLTGALSMFPGLHKAFTMQPDLASDMGEELGTKYSWGGQD